MYLDLNPKARLLFIYLFILTMIWILSLYFLYQKTRIYYQMVCFCWIPFFFFFFGSYSENEVTMNIPQGGQYAFHMHNGFIPLNSRCKLIK